MASGQANGISSTMSASKPAQPKLLFWRIFAWAIVAILFVFLINNYLTFWRGWPGLNPLFNGEFQALALVQAGLYLAALIGCIFYVYSSPSMPVRLDGERLTVFTNFIIRAAFWMVLLVGLVDMIISFLRVESILPALVGEALTQELGRSQFRGPYVHLPLILLAVVIAALTRGLAVTWLALLVVLAEFQIVLTRFIFSYEQAFMGDLVRFWYASLFLFASAFTLVEEGHVRVDVLYMGFSKKTKAKVNIVGTILLGMSLCAVIVGVGFWGKSSIINSPMLALEVTQAGFGMYVKYLMAMFLGIFAVSMMTQFAGYLLFSLADYYEDTGSGQQAPPSGQAAGAV